MLCDLTEVTELLLEPGFEHRQSGSRISALNHYTIIVSMIVIMEFMFMEYL